MPTRTATWIRDLLAPLCLALATALPIHAAEPQYVGSGQCAPCHAEQTRAWQGSHHDLAMQVASPTHVLGDFDDAKVTHQGVTSRFTRKEDRFFVRTEGADGQLHDFEIAYTFGVDPLQQYLVRFPDGRIQALNLAWDTRPKARGGQRWFAVYGNEPIAHDDVLHWTGPGQNWNHMCAECHSTNVRKGYDAETDRFETTWSEIDVGCEACHGPGSRHVDWMKKERQAVNQTEPRAGSGLTIDFTEDERARWERKPGMSNAVRVPPRERETQLHLCARCHSRRSTLVEGIPPGQPIHDSHRVATLDASLYHPDGQILDEVYVYGSFVQSAMYAAGVTCGDCHDPHTARLRADGNALCGRCHDPKVYDTTAHHHHPATSSGAQCVECHMPSRTYMQIDTRRDHGLRVPRPDLSGRLDSPNACNACHRSTTHAWAARQIASWQGPDWRPPRHFGTALHAARTNAPEAERALAGVLRDADVPAIARATAVDLLPPFASPQSMPLFPEALGETDPMVRAAAIAALEGLALEARLDLIAPLLDDPVRAVRWEAARVLADAPPNQLDGATKKRRDTQLAEYRASLERDADRPEAHMRLAALALAEGKPAAAKTAFLDARQRNPKYVPAYVNLADLHRALGENERSERVLREGLSMVPGQPDLRHALGLALVRLGRKQEAVAELAAAASDQPENPRYAYVYAAALHESGESEGARRVLREALARHPRDRDLAAFLSSLDARERSR